MRSSVSPRRKAELRATKTHKISRFRHAHAHVGLCVLSLIY